MAKPNRYTKTTAKKHVMKTVAHRVTKKTRKDSLDNKNFSIMYDDIDTALKNVLVAIAGTKVETYGIGLINNMKIKLTKKMKKLQNRKK